MSALEEGVLGVNRPVDVPGWLIPGLYFEYVRERDARRLVPVFAHNQQDILSLAALTVRLGRHIERPFAEARDAVDLYSVGRIFEAATAWEDCIMCYERALAGQLPARLQEEALCRLGFVYKRLQRGANAAQVWRSLVSRPESLGLLPFVELAKHLEHRERDYAEAAAVVERALTRVQLRAAEPWQRPGLERERRDLERRRLRLQKKLAGLSGPKERKT